MTNKATLLFIISTALCWMEVFSQPAPPSGFVHDSIYSTSIILSWNEVDDTTYNMVVMNGGETTSNCDAGTTVTSPHTVDQRTSLTSYMIGLCAVNSIGQSSNPSTLSITTGPPPPYNVRVFSSTTNTLTVEWNDECAEGIVVCDNDRTTDQYMISYGDGEGTLTRTVDAPTTQYIITNLLPNNIYDITVMIVGRGSNIYSDESQVGTGITIPGQPNPPTPISSTNTSITLQWNDLAGTAQETYTVIQDGVEVMSGINTNMATIDGLTSNTNYQFQIKASNDGGDGQISDPLTLTTIPGQPNPPTLISSTTTSITLQWNDLAGTAQDTYTVIQDGTEVMSGINTSMATIDGLTSNTNYQFQVKASNGGGDGQVSDAQNSITIPGQPNPPTSTSSTTTSITLQWNDLLGTVQETYSVLLQNGTVVMSGINVSNVTIDDLNSNTNYQFQVKATNDGGDGQISDAQTSTTIPGQPNLPTSISSTNTSITLQWNDLVGTVQETYTVIQDGVEVMSGINTNMATIDGLTSNTNYQFQIKASNVGGNGQLSDASMSTTIPSFPENINKCLVGDNTMEICIKWFKPSGGDAISGYLVVWNSYQVNGSYYVIHDVDIDEYDYLISELLPGYDTEIIIEANNSAGIGEKEKKLFTTYPSAPHNVVIFPGTNEITLIWDELVGRWDEIVIESVNKTFDTVILNNTSINETKVTGLNPGRVYTIRMYSVVYTNDKTLESEKHENSTMTRSNPSSDKSAVIIGAVVGSVFGLIIILAGVLFYRKRKSTKQSTSDSRNELTTSTQVITNNQAQLSDLPPPPPHNTATSLSIQPGIKSIELNEFNDYFNSMKKNVDEKFYEEFKGLFSFGRNLLTEVGSDPSNKNRNRYKNILPYDDNRVILTPTHEFQSTYINASYIDGFDQKFIATQAPLSATLDDFWRMIWDQNCSNIVMLTQLVENGKRKCELYWPQNKNSLQFGGLKIEMKSENQKREWVERSFSLTKNYQARDVRHYHYTSWPDHGVPETSQGLVRFVSYVRSESNSASKTLVHCSAGVGRTGTYIAVDYLLQHLKTNPSTVDIFGLIKNMRIQRMFMVQTVNQYIFLHKTVLEIINHGYDVKDDNGGVLYENVTIRKQSPLYENTSVKRS